MSARTAKIRPRKKPSQRRSRETFDAILDATARILVSRGWARTTTNHVAERAGVSIGTLYEWFPGKEALATALVERHLDRAEALLAARAEQLAGAGELSLLELASRLVDAMIALHEDDPKLHRALFEEVPHGAAVRARVRGLEDRLALLLGEALLASPRVKAPDPRLAARVVVDVLEATTHRWATDTRGDPVSREVLHDELTRLIAGYLATPPITSRASRSP